MKDKSLFIYSILLLIFAFISFIYNSEGSLTDKKPTAFDWPAMDMAPFFIKNTNPDLLKNDFFASSSILPNPRHIFGNIVISVNFFLQTDWYSALYFLKSIIYLLTPLLFFLVFYKSIANYSFFESKKSLNYLKKYLFLIISIFAFFPSFSKHFSIAWWPPYFIQATPQHFSLFLSLIGFCILLFNYRRFIISFFFLFLSTLCHPSVGIFSIIFFIIINPNLYKLKSILLFCISGMILPLIILKIIFTADEALNAKDFIYHYMYVAHPSHYIPSKFGNLTGYSWIYSFAIVSLLLVIPIIFSFFLKKKNIIYLSIISFFSYISSVLMQYIFIVCIPIKEIAVLSPVRFSVWGLWLIVVNFSFVVYYFFYKIKFFGNIFILEKIKILKISIIKKFISYQKFLKISTKYIKFFIAFTIIIMLITLMFLKDDPIKDFKIKNNEFVNWIEKNTKQDDVFITYFYFPKIQFPIITKRALFVGNGFPFREDKIKEFSHRHSLIYGKPEQINKIKGSWIGEKYANFFRLLSPENFVSISKIYKIDYVIVEKKYSEKFNKISSLYKDNEKLIYSIEKIKTYLLDF